MRRAGLVCGFAMLALLAGAAEGQQGPTPSPAFIAERDAALDALVKAEKLANAGQRGPATEACQLMASYFLHTVKAAVEAGAKTRVADWAELDWQEQSAVKEKVPDVYERNTKLRQHLCTLRP